MIALFPSLGYQELFLLLVIGLLLYGRNLPEAGRSLGKVVAQLKRSWYDFKDQLDREGEIRDVKQMFQDTAREMKNVTKVPRAIGNPGRAIRDLTHEAMSEPIPDQMPDQSSGELPEDLPDEPGGHEPQQPAEPTRESGSGGAPSERDGDKNP